MHIALTQLRCGGVLTGVTKMKSLIAGAVSFFVLASAFVLGFLVRGDMPPNKVIEREVILNTTTVTPETSEASEIVLKIDNTNVYVDDVKADMYLAAEAARSANKKGKSVIVKITATAKVSAVTGLQKLLKSNLVPYEEIRMYDSLPDMPGAQPVEPTGPSGKPLI
jgi:hypothetical protein